MLIKKTKNWEIKENQTTSHSLWKNRREILKTIGVAGGIAGGIGAGSVMGAIGNPLSAWSLFDDDKVENNDDPFYHNGNRIAANQYPAKINNKYTVSRPTTNPKDALTFNNFYEFGSSKDIYEKSQKMSVEPWVITIDGLVDKPFQIGIDDLISKFGLETRVCRFRCVETWAMVVPWTGFSLSKLVELAKPLSSAKYLKIETLADKDSMTNLKASWLPWPYIEGLTIKEATNELAFLATGIYDEPIVKQSGAPIRLVLPWKYGFKSIKSIVKISFTDKKPVSFWEKIQGNEYGFWANVNPAVPHQRWSQASEKLLGSNDRIETLLYNGYGENVADLYEGELKQKYGDKLFW